MKLIVPHRRPTAKDIERFTEWVVEEMFRIAPEVKSFDDERRDFYIRVALRHVKQHLNEGGSVSLKQLTKPAAETLAAPIITTANHEWAVHTGEIPEDDGPLADNPEYQDAKAEWNDFLNWLKRKECE